MRLHVHKKGLRALGIAESFQKGESREAILAGVVMRGDFQIDGFVLTKITVGGLDATEGVLRLFEDLKRRDINLLMLNGCVISWYNIIELSKVFREINLPLICVTYEESEGLEKFFKDNFKDWKRRVAKYKRLGTRTPIKLRTKKKVLVRFLGIENEKEVKRVLDKFTIQGAVPEPLRVARLLARTIMRSER